MSMIEVVVASFLGIIVVMGVGYAINAMVRGRDTVFQKGSSQSDLALAVENVLLVGRMAGATDETTKPPYACRRCRAPGGSGAGGQCPPLKTEDTLNDKPEEFALQCNVDFDVPPAQKYMQAEFRFDRDTRRLIYSRQDTVGGALVAKKTYSGVAAFTVCDETDMEVTTNAKCTIGAYRIADNIAKADPAVWDGINRAYTNSLGNQCSATVQSNKQQNTCGSGTYKGTAGVDNRFFRFRIQAESNEEAVKGLGSEKRTVGYRAEIQSAFFTRNPPFGYNNVAYQWGTLE